MHKGAERIRKNLPWPRSLALQHLGAQELRSFFSGPFSVFITTGTSWGQLAIAQRSSIFTPPPFRLPIQRLPVALEMGAVGLL